MVQWAGSSCEVGETFANATGIGPPQYGPAKTGHLCGGIRLRVEVLLLIRLAASGLCPNDGRRDFRTADWKRDRIFKAGLVCQGRAVQE
jgi:hypothetical protein